MRGVAGGAALIAAGVALVAHSSLSLDAARARELALLFAAAGRASDAPTRRDFLETAAFATAMDEPVYTSFYVFNVTNAARVLRGSEAPSVHQLGPYTYEKRSRKINVQFVAAPFNSSTNAPSEADNLLAASFGRVSYQVMSSYVFAPERSNGSETDLAVTVNATFARKLHKLRARGYAERFMLAEFAQQHMSEYARHLREEFLADTKLRAWTHFLPALVEHAHRQVLPAAIALQRQRVDSSSIPANLVRAYAVVRTEMIPRVLGDVYKDISSEFLPEILQTNLDTARRQALPRVLDNLYRRLKVESVPFWLQQQLQSQQTRHVPMTLASLKLKIESIAFPYTLREVYDRSCLEAVPLILRAIKIEIIESDIARNRVSADDAQRGVVEIWRKQGSTATDFDAWIDDSPTGTPRTGFELQPTSASLQLSVEAARLILGSVVSNKRFSIIDYDPAVTATYPLDEPTVTPVGFGIWKQVIAMNETAIEYVLQGVNYDVALPGDYLTRSQLLFIRQYLIGWATSAITQRDRERFWRQSFTRRTAHSDQMEPDVDLDIEQAGVQRGFNIRTGGASTSGITAVIAQQLWNATSKVSLVNPQGFTVWQSAISGAASSIQTLKDGITGLTAAQITEVGVWIQILLRDGFVWRRAMRQWSDGTCKSVLKLPITPCLMYDLEPSIAGNQTGFEMNPQSREEAKVSQTVRDLLWDRRNSASFLVSVHPSNTALGFGMWLHSIRTSNFARLVDSASIPGLTVANAQAISGWLANWSMNELNALNVYNWWRASTCWKREGMSSTAPNSIPTPNLQACTESYREVESSSVLRTESTRSPFFTWEKSFAVTETTCTLDAASGTYTRTVSTYDIMVRVFSCDVISTSLSDDTDEVTFGFEMAPSIGNAGDRVSLAAAKVLWEPANPFAFVNLDGYKRWFEASSSADDTALLSDINGAVDAACSTITGGGERSAIFNETFSVTEWCGRISFAHLDKVRQWVRTHSSSDWIPNVLLDQWRRGTAMELDIEPYRSGDQQGWELAFGCAATACVLSDDHKTMYQVPREALSLWDSRQAGSFLHGDGWDLWVAVLNAIASADVAAEITAKAALVTACQASSWQGWMQRVLDWLGAWIKSEHLLRDVLGHWMYAQCPTTPTLVNVIQRDPDVVTTVNACPPTTSRYSITLKDSIADLQQLASRPTEFFKPDVAETSATVRPKKTVEVDESWVACEQHQNSNQFQQTVSSQKSMKEYHACNFLSVMADASTLGTLATNTGSGFRPLPVAQAELSFEMNLSVAPSITIDIALQAWNQSLPFAFTNLTVFLERWYPAVTRSSLLEEIRVDLVNAAGEQTPVDLTSVQSYLRAWLLSSTSTRRVGIAWVSQTGVSIDLDSVTDGIQGGFELFPSGEWKKIAGDNLPSIDQSQYLWRATNTFSFLKMDKSLTSSGLPTGFTAWKEIYSGVDYSSEKLVPVYPAEARVQRATTMAYTLSADERRALLLEMAAETTLTEIQLQGIAAWLMKWESNVVLRDYILHQWAVGVTPHGEEGYTFDLASQLARLYGFHSRASAPQDLLTLAPFTVASVPAASRKSLWDVQIPGSLLNPTTQVLWCTIAANGAVHLFCPSILDEFGAVTQTALTTFKTLTQSLVKEEITTSSNFTKIALTFLQKQFAIDDENAVFTIASWWRELPSASAFFKANQLRVWRADNTAVSSDPLRFGFDLGFVFPMNSTVPRNATSLDLAVNIVTISSSTTNTPLSTCNESLELFFAFWEPSNAMSFLHPDGIQLWRQFFQNEVDEPSFLRSILTSSDTSIVEIISSASLDTADVSCALQATKNWLASWQHHPNLRQFVEFLWSQPLKSTLPSSLSSSLLADASNMLRAFPLAATFGSDLSSAPGTSISLSLWTNFSRVILDPTQLVSLANMSDGFPLWRSLLVDCFSSDATTGECRNTFSASKSRYSDEVAIAKIALGSLSAAIRDQLAALAGNQVPTRLLETKPLEVMITAHVVPWMLGWLRHPLFQDFVLAHTRDSHPAQFEQIRSFVDLAAAQFVNGSVTLANYSILTVLDNHHLPGAAGVEQMDAGVASERFVRQKLVFDAVLEKPQLRNTSGLPGFGELKAFCDLNDHDIVFAYDVRTECKLNVDYTVSVQDANSLISLFSDTTSWEWPNLNESTPGSPSLPITTRAALLIDAFVAQPFSSKDECEFLVRNIAAAYKLSAALQQQACVSQSTSSEIYLDLPMLADAGFKLKPKSFVTDLQAYLRYAATRFVFEPSVLGVPSVEFVSGAPPADPGALQYPIGGYLAASNVSSVLFGRVHSSESDQRSGGDSTIEHDCGQCSGIWRNDSIANSQATDFFVSRPPQMLTLQVPLLNDSALYLKKRRVIGEVLAIDNATELLVWGEKIALNAVRVTDGSQFATAVLSAKHANGGKDFPPTKILFYWGYARRLVEATYTRNITRFGIPLMRYTVSSWLDPPSLPSGLSSDMTARVSSSIPMLNMSFLHDDLQLALSGASPLGGEVPDTNLDIDPVTGFVYYSRFIWQLNALVARDASHDEWHRSMSECWLPVVWVREQSSVTSTSGLLLAAVMNPGPFAREKVARWEVVGGGICIVVGVVLAFISARRHRMLRLHQIRSVMPEQTVFELGEAKATGGSTTHSTHDKDTGRSKSGEKATRLRHRDTRDNRDNSGESETQTLAPLKDEILSSNNSSSNSLAAANTELSRGQQVLQQSSESRSGSGSRRARRKRSQSDDGDDVQRIVDQTNDVADDARDACVEQV